MYTINRAWLPTLLTKFIKSEHLCVEKRDRYSDKQTNKGWIESNPGCDDKTRLATIAYKMLKFAL